MDHDDLITLSKLSLYKSFSYARSMATNGVNYYDRAKRQAKVSTRDAYCFYSYETLIAIHLDGQMYLTSDWNYSRTTSKYCSKFLQQDSNSTRGKLQNSTYIYLEHHWKL